MPDRAGLDRFVRFVVVGLASTGVYFVFLLLLEGWIAKIWMLTGIAYALSMAVNYVAQARFTFRAKVASDRSIFRYFVMHGAALTVNAGAMTLLVGYGLPLLTSQIAVTAVITIAVFIVSKLWVFSAESTAPTI